MESSQIGSNILAAYAQLADGSVNGTDAQEQAKTHALEFASNDAQAKMSMHREGMLNDARTALQGTFVIETITSAQSLPLG